MTRYADAIVSITLALAVTGCATVINGTTQRVRFDSTPSGATAQIGATGKTATQTVTTPGQLTLSRDSSYEVAFEKPGYIPAHARVDQATSDAVWVNILIGGIIGIIVDYSDGAAYDLVPETVSTTLVADPTTPPPTEGHTSPDSDPAAIPAH